MIAAVVVGGALVVAIAALLAKRRQIKHSVWLGKGAGAVPLDTTDTSDTSDVEGQNGGQGGGLLVYDNLSPDNESDSGSMRRALSLTGTVLLSPVVANETFGENDAQRSIEDPEVASNASFGGANRAVEPVLLPVNTDTLADGLDDTDSEAEKEDFKKKSWREPFAAFLGPFCSVALPFQCAGNGGVPPGVYSSHHNFTSEYELDQAWDPDDASIASADVGSALSQAQGKDAGNTLLDSFQRKELKMVPLTVLPREPKYGDAGTVTPATVDL
jgi:hypothetical protein